jgi:hypothetical protein
LFRILDDERVLAPAVSTTLSFQIPELVDFDLAGNVFKDKEEGGGLENHELDYISKVDFEDFLNDL